MSDDFRSRLYEVSPKASRQDKLLNATAPLKLMVIALALALAVTVDTNLWLRLGLGALVILAAYVWLKLPQRPVRTRVFDPPHPPTRPTAFQPQGKPASSQKQALLDRARRYENQASDPMIARDPARQEQLLDAAQRCRRAAETYQ